MMSKMFGKAKYGQVALTAALVFAMCGGAYAANKYVINSVKQINPKVLKKLAGKRGKAGTLGSVGAQGSAGLNGKDGSNGKDGAPGQSVVEKEVKVGDAACNKLGGAVSTVGNGSPVFVCNGQTGFTETLPSEKTLTGDWNATAVVQGAGLPEGFVLTAVSFGIPLATAPEPTYINRTVAEEEANTFPTPPAGCTGNVDNPGAEPGHLCVFASAAANAAKVYICSSAQHLAFRCLFGLSPDASDRSGFLVGVLGESKGLVDANGTWAVTAE